MTRLSFRIRVENSAPSVGGGGGGIGGGTEAWTIVVLEVVVSMSRTSHISQRDRLA